MTASPLALPVPYGCSDIPVQRRTTPRLSFKEQDSTQHLVRDILVQRPSYYDLLGCLLSLADGVSGTVYPGRDISLTVLRITAQLQIFTVVYQLGDIIYI